LAGPLRKEEWSSKGIPIRAISPSLRVDILSRCMGI